MNRETPANQQAILERIAELSHVSLMVPQESYESNRRRFQDQERYEYPRNPDGTAIVGSTPAYVVVRADASLPIELSRSYGHWDTLSDSADIDPQACYMLVDYAGGSDYSGDLVSKSNHKALVDMMPEGYEDGSEYLDYCGGHGTYALAIRLDSVTPELLEAIESLDDYPILDESLHSEMEMEAQNEAWESTYRSEFMKELGKALYATFESSKVSEQRPGESEADLEARLSDSEAFLSDDCGDLDTSTIDELFHKMSDAANVYWVNECGSDCSIDADEVVSRGLTVRKGNPSDWNSKAVAEIEGLIRSGMGERKYDLGIVPYLNPAQMSFDFPQVA